MHCISEFWTALTDQVPVSSSSQQVSTSCPLNPGRSYRFGLQFCAADLCYKTLYTSGVTIIPNPPKTGQMIVSYIEDGPKVCKFSYDCCNKSVFKVNDRALFNAGTETG